MSEVSEIQGILIKDAKAREDIAELQEKTTNLENELDNIPTNTNTNVVKNTLVIGDSYLCGQYVNDTPDYSDDNWGTFLKNLMGLSDTEFFSFGEGGSGFTNKGNQDHTFLELLQANISSITNPENIKNIIVCGGCNDVNASSQATIETAIESFVTYCKTTFPNAEVYVGMIGNYKMTTPTLPGRPVLKTRVYKAYLNCRKYGALYLNGVEYVMQDYKNNFSSDGVHPSLNGQKEIASAIYQVLKTGSVKIVKNTTTKSLTNSEISTSTMVFSEQQVHDKILCVLNGNMKFASKIGKGTKIINFGVMELDYIRKTSIEGENASYQNYNISARLCNSGYTNEITVEGVFYLSATGEVKMSFDVPSTSYTDLDTLVLYYKGFTMDAMNC